MKSVSSDLPIAVFDSGVGGLTVLRTLKELLPHDSFLYLGDMARVPYGTKSPSAIVSYTLGATKFLVQQKIKLLVVACNTASTLALPTLENNFPELPIVGMIEPGARAAVAASRNGCIVVIATEATVKAQGYQKAVQQLSSPAKVMAQACSIFVALAEEGWVNGPIAESIARQYISPLFEIDPKPDCLLLGCTHFPLLKESIQNVVGYETSIIDPALETALTVKKILQQRSLINTQPPASATHIFQVTDFPERFANVAAKFLGTPISMEHIQSVSFNPH